MGEVKLANGSEVVFLELGDTTDFVSVQSVDVLEKGDLLEKVMASERVKIEASKIQDPEKGEVIPENPKNYLGNVDTWMIAFQIVACLWTEVNEYYRGKILSVDPGRKKARVLFIDFGNVAIESFSSISALPAMAVDPKKYPALANNYKLVCKSSLNVRPF